MVGCDGYEKLPLALLRTDCGLAGQRGQPSEQVRVLAAQSSRGPRLAELMARLGHSTPAAAMRCQHTAQGRDQVIAEMLSKLASDD